MRKNSIFTLSIVEVLSPDRQAQKEKHNRAKKYSDMDKNIVKSLQVILKLLVTSLIIFIPVKLQK
jgi:hypothetical protein